MDIIANAPAGRPGQCPEVMVTAAESIQSSYQNLPVLPSLQCDKENNDKINNCFRQLQTLEPYPLIRNLPASMVFPVEALPCVMRAAAQRVAEVVQAPLDMICQSFLSAATLAAQPHANVAIDGRSFPLSNFFLAIAVSGERKSATDRIATGPFKDRQKRDTEIYFMGKNEFELAHAAWEKACKDALKKGDGGLVSQVSDEPTHIQPFYIFEEPTFEGIERAYAEGRYALGLFSDEGGRFLGGFAMNRDNQTKTVTGLSKFWDGEPIDRVRAGEGLSALYGRRFSMHLMIQPVIAEGLFSNAMISGQGFLSRCLCCKPTSNIGNRPYKGEDLTISPEILDYNRTINALLDRPLPLHDQRDMGLNPATLTLSADAKIAWVNFSDEVEERQREEGDLFSIRGFASKAAEHAARIAGVLSVFTDPDVAEIRKAEMDAGIAILRYYLGETLRLFNSYSEDQNLVTAEKVLAWGLTKQGGVVALLDVCRLGPYQARSKAKASKIMAILEEHNCALRVDGGAVVNGRMRQDVWVFRK